MAGRRDEASRTWFRSDRVFRVDGDWFIHTREGIAVGPYSDKFAADVDAGMLKSLLAGVNPEEAFRIIQEFMETGGNLGRRVNGKPEVDEVEVASLLDDGDIEYTFDNLRQLS